MRIPMAVTTVIAAVLATSVSLSAPATAGPGIGQCGMMPIPICALIPVVPDLDHDVDLTQDPSTSGGDAVDHTGSASSG